MATPPLVQDIPMVNATSSTMSASSSVSLPAVSSSSVAVDAPGSQSFSTTHLLAVSIPTTPRSAPPAYAAACDLPGEDSMHTAVDGTAELVPAPSSFVGDSDDSEVTPPEYGEIESQFTQFADANEEPKVLVVRETNYANIPRHVLRRKQMLRGFAMGVSPFIFSTCMLLHVLPMWFVHYHNPRTPTVDPISVKHRNIGLWVQCATALRGCKRMTEDNIAFSDPAFRLLEISRAILVVGMVCMLLYAVIVYTYLNLNKRALALKFRYALWALSLVQSLALGLGLLVVLAAAQQMPGAVLGPCVYIGFVAFALSMVQNACHFFGLCHCYCTVELDPITLNREAYGQVSLPAGF
eukprot:comp22706_c0_seq1/m.35251 comp22706_c0_seq1/g.35251  ORF comp22706_c0_seq1/g.35251 comp22706_c0_seq1/m.35251 type:complete len:352 (-) comp22706_c0_seq1:418-1473(-)